VHGITEIFSVEESNPDPSRALSTKIPYSGIVSANECMSKLLDSTSDSEKCSSASRGPYNILTPAQKYEI